MEEEIVYLEKQKMLSNRTISVKIKEKLITDTSVLCGYIEEERLRKECEEGCVNFGRKWSCPPFSKSFLSIQKKYASAYLICFSTVMKDYADIKNKNIHCSLKIPKNPVFMRVCGLLCLS